MEVNYGVTTTNKFDVFLNEDEDPLDILRLEESRLKKKTEKKKNSPTDKVKSKTSDDARKPTDVAGQKRDGTYLYFKYLNFKTTEKDCVVVEWSLSRHSSITCCVQHERSHK